MAKSKITLEVEVRERVGKGGAREARRNGFVPGVLYGGELGPVSITLKGKEVMKAIESGKFLSHLVTITHKGKPQLVIPQDVQYHPVTDLPLHIDLYRVKEKQEISIEVPVHFIGEEVSPGIKRGGTLNVVRHVIELDCRADSIPEQINIDISKLQIGDNVKMSDITLPDGVTSTIQDRDFTIATIAGRVAQTETTETEAEDAEGEDESEED